MIAIALWDLYRVNEANFRENHARKFNKSRWHFTRNFIRSHVGLHSRSTGNIYSKVSKHSQKSNNSVFHYWVADKGKGIPSWFFPFSRAKCARELASKHADTDALALKFYSINVDKKKKKGKFHIVNMKFWYSIFVQFIILLISILSIEITFGIYFPKCC